MSNASDVAQWEAYAARLVSAGKEDTAEYAAVLQRIRDAQPPVDNSPRGIVEWLLTAWLEAGPPPWLPKDRATRKAVVRVPVIREGTLAGYVMEPADDYREMASAAQQRRIRELQQALATGADPYWIAFLALEIGVGNRLPDTLIGQLVSDGGKKGIRARAADEGDELAGRNESIRRELLARHASHPRESFRHVCETLAPKHGLNGHKQIGRICADLKW